MMVSIPVTLVVDVDFDVPEGVVDSFDLEQVIEMGAFVTLLNEKRRDELKRCIAEDCNIPIKSVDISLQQLRRLIDFNSVSIE